jgi:transposase
VELKEYMVERMLGPERESASALARETGLSLTTLSRWRERARSVAAMTHRPRKKDRPPNARRPQDWPAEERLCALGEAASLPDEQLGAWLRERGLHAAHLAQWREAAVRGLQGRSGAPGEARRVRDLERDLARKDKALAETAALLVLAGKARALWGDEGGSTGSK